MKRIVRIIICMIALSGAAWAQELPTTPNNGSPEAEVQWKAGLEQVITGTVRDKETHKRLENVSVSLAGTSIGTVTNAEGFFSLKIPRRQTTIRLELAHMGYTNTHYTVEPTALTDKNVTLFLKPAAHYLKEVVVYGGEARYLVEEALSKISANYPKEENMLGVFYRETVQKGHRYIGVSEAMMDVYKTSYATPRSVNHDKVEVKKARRLLSQKASDTLAIKVVGGPTLAATMDFVKNGEALFDEKTMDYYSFGQEGLAMLDNRMQYVIRFKPRVHLDYALFVGKLYIDSERHTFTRAEFSLDLSDREKAVAAILYKKPLGLRFRPLELSFLITYRQQGDVAYLNYIGNEIRFKCDWKRRLFSSSYTARTEMVVVEHEANPERVILRKNAFKPRQVLYDLASEYWADEAFWKEYNIIEPTESLENAVKKLYKANGHKE